MVVRPAERAGKRDQRLVLYPAAVAAVLDLPHRGHGHTGDVGEFLLSDAADRHTLVDRVGDCGPILADDRAPRRVDG